MNISKKLFVMAMLISCTIISMEKFAEQKSKEAQEEHERKIAEEKEELLRLAHELQQTTWAPRATLIEIEKAYTKGLDQCIKEYDQAIAFLHLHTHPTLPHLKDQKVKILAALHKAEKLKAEVAELRKAHDAINIKKEEAQKKDAAEKMKAKL